MSLTYRDYEEGFELGRRWIGPNGDGSLGSLSLDFIIEQSGFDPDCQEHGPRLAAYMRGFHDGRAAR